MDEKDKKALKTCENILEGMSIEDLAEEMINNKYSKMGSPFPELAGTFQ